MTADWSLRPAVQGYRGAVVAGHPAAAQVGLEVLRSGGNAIDAGVAAGLAMNVLLSHECGFFGVAPTLVYLAQTEEVVNLDGVGVWPAAISVDMLAESQRAGSPNRDVLHTLTPGTPDTWIEALSRYGTRTFGQSAAPAIELARAGFPMYRYLHQVLTATPEAYRKWPGSAAVFLPDGAVPRIGMRVVQADLAETLTAIGSAEASASDRGRVAGLLAARDYIYKGPLAERYVEYCRSLGGILTRDDMAEHRVRSERPARVTYRGKDVYSSALGQGPVFPLALKILEGFDLAGMQHNAADYIHVVSQALDLAFADREAHMGDPALAPVGIQDLLAASYAAARRTLIDEQRAWREAPPAGDPARGGGVLGAPRSAADPPTAAPLAGRSGGGTAFVGVIDSDGNVFSCVASDGARSCPVIPGTGVGLSLRGIQCSLAAGHVAGPAPGKRPRLTPAPALVVEAGRATMALGGFGGDLIPQAMLQIFLNAVEFGRDPQEAVEAPRFYSANFPTSFYEPKYEPGVLKAETRIPAEVLHELRARGHDVQLLPEWWEGAALYGLISVAPSTNVIQAGADPRGGGYALAC